MNIPTTYTELNLFTVEKQPSALKANRAELKLAKQMILG